MREALDRMLRDRPVVAVAFGIALGWSLIQVAEGMAALVSGLLIEVDRGDEGFFFPSAIIQYSGVLTWNVGGRLLTFGALLAGLVQLIVVLAAAAFVYRRYRRLPDAPAAEDA